MKMKKIKEEIGRNYQTLDNGPISFDYDTNIDVETHPLINDSGWEVKITCSSHPEYSVPTQVFPDEAMAHHYAKAQVSAIKTKIVNESRLRMYIRSLILNS